VVVGEHQFDWSEVLDDLRCRETPWLESAREEAVAEQRRWHLRELAILSVLDERNRVDDTDASRQGTSTRAARRKRGPRRSCGPSRTWRTRLLRARCPTSSSTR
jgi:hypothetical protein